MVLSVQFGPLRHFLVCERRGRLVFWDRPTAQLTVLRPGLVVVRDGSAIVPADALW